MVSVELTGLKDHPECNGKHVELLRCSPDNGYWDIYFEGMPMADFKAQPAQLKLQDVPMPNGLRSEAVILCNIKSRPELNGTVAQRGSFLAHQQRWKVTLPSGKVALLQSTCLKLVDSGNVVEDPVKTGSCERFEEQQAVYAVANFKEGQIVFEEEPVAGVPICEPWDANLRRQVDTFLQWDSAKQAAALNFMIHPTLRLGSDDPRHWQRCADSAEAMARLGLDSIDPGKISRVWDFLRIMQANAYATADGRHALFATLCRVNHSCNPNVLRFDHGTSKVLIALRDIQAGEELAINYFSDTQLLEPTVYRHRITGLLGFQCSCVRCTMPEDDVRVFRCPKECGGKCFANKVTSGISKCELCSGEWEIDEAEAMLKEEALLLEAVSRLEQNLCPSNSKFLEDMISASIRSLSPTHGVTAKLHRFANDAYHQEGCLAKALEHSASELQVWSCHIKRPSQQIAWKRKLRADDLLASGDWAMAFREYSEAVAEMRKVMPIDSQRFEELRRLMRRTLDLKGSMQN